MELRVPRLGSRSERLMDLVVTFFSGGRGHDQHDREPRRRACRDCRPADRFVRTVPSATAIPINERYVETTETRTLFNSQA